MIPLLPWNVDPATALTILLWSTVAAACVLAAMVLAALLLQVRADRRNARRIEAFQCWEAALPAFMFDGGEVPALFTRVEPDLAELLRDLLSRYLPTIAGTEAGNLKRVYFAAGLDGNIGSRLREGSPRVRALAALEVGAYGLDGHLRELVPVLADPVPFVAYAAARTLAQSRDLTYAGPVVEWVFTQDQYQQERLIALLEGFGPALLPWLEALLRDRPLLHDGWRLFALLVAFHRHHESLPVLLELLDSPEPEVLCAAMRGLHALGDPQTYPAVLRFKDDGNPVLRMQAAQSLGVLGGPGAIPELLRLLADPAYDVRRHASHSLTNLGVPGVQALEAVAADPAADPFARDMARERLEWVEHRGRL